MPLDQVNEGTTVRLRFTFRDQDDALAAPTSITYRVDDHASGAEVLGDTAVASPAAVVDVNLGPSVVAIIDTTRRSETKVVTLTGVYSAGVDEVVGVYRFSVRNLRFAP